MTEQPLDLHRFGRTLARGKSVLAVCAVLGIVGAGLLTYLRTERYSATALMLLPPAPTDQNGQPTRTIGTQLQIATSTGVLGPAAAHIAFHGGLNQFKHQVSVSSPAPDVLKFVGKAQTPQTAIAISNAVANSYREVVAATAKQQSQAVIVPLEGQATALRNELTSATANLNEAQRTGNQSAMSQWAEAQNSDSQQLAAVTSQISLAQLCPLCSTGSYKSLEVATSASNDIVRTATRTIAVGAFVGILVGIVFLLLRETRDDRVVERREADAPSQHDEVVVSPAADAPEVASIVARRPGTVDDWHTLLAQYQPSADERWALRRVLRGLLAAEARPPAHVCIMTLSQDIDAVSIAPQLAAFAASAGVRTLLVVTGRDPAVAALRQACRETALSHEPVRSNLWTVDGQVDEDEWPSLQLIVTSVVGDQPALGGAHHPSSTLLAISGFAATPKRIATAAAAAAAANHPWAGVIVANPELGDGTIRRVADAS